MQSYGSWNILFSVGRVDAFKRRRATSRQFEQQHEGFHSWFNENTLTSCFSQYVTLLTPPGPKAGNETCLEALPVDLW